MKALFPARFHALDVYQPLARSSSLGVCPWSARFEFLGVFGPMARLRAVGV